MTPETYRSKLANWLARHPVRTPPASGQASYTREVMARVERLSSAPSPARIPRGWAIGTVAALACAAIMMVASQSPTRLTSAIARDADVLSAVGESPAVLPADIADVAEELQMTDRLMLAELPPDEDEAWMQETLQLLGELEDEPSDAGDESSLQDYYELLEEELRRLDEDELESA